MDDVKTLLILRHAKSSWKYETLPDHERPLNRRGIGDAPEAGEEIARRQLHPGHVVCSTAVRAQTTARLAAAACGYEGPIELRHELYLSSAEAYLEALRRIPAEVERAMIVGHNPDVEDLVRMLTGSEETMPTAALAHVELSVERWDELLEGLSGTLVSVWRPGKR